MKFFFTIIVVTIWHSIFANDGAFYASGNQLIPIEETEISIQKEILKIERLHNDLVRVDVDYTFLNPGSEKQLLVGFEAPSPSGDVDGTPKNGMHPYISQFVVTVNNSALPFKCSIVKTSEYYEKGKLKEVSEKEAMGDYFNENEPEFFYVYHFQAVFKKGINKISHSYFLKLSGSIDMPYQFEYILTAATRWANKSIQDFTLIVDWGDFQEFYIDKSFFSSSSDWSSALKFMDAETIPFLADSAGTMKVISGDEPIIFKKMNFSPQGELYIFTIRDLEVLENKAFDSKQNKLPYNVSDFIYIKNATDVDSYKILRNLPYARRGYVFSTPTIQKYYESLSWYVPNAEYKATLESLNETEKAWLEGLKSGK